MKNIALITITSAIIFLLILAGGAYPWATWIAAAVLCVIYLIETAKNKHDAANHILKRYKFIELCFLASLLFLMLMLQPMPTALTRLSGITRFQQNKIAAQALTKAAKQGIIRQTTSIRHPTFTITRNRAGTMRNTILLIALFATLLLTSRLTDKQRQIFLAFLCLLGGTLAVAGYISLRVKPQGDTIWWIHKIPHNLPGPILCFVNRNHFAGYLAMLSPPALALFFHNAKNKRPLLAVINIMAFVVMTGVMALTLSRGAVLGYCAGLIALLLIYLINKKWIPAIIMVFLGIALAAAVIFIAPPQFKQRMSALRAPLEKGNFDERLDEWKTCGSIWKTYPLLGAGPDAYRMVYPQHRTTSRREYTTHAENEYLQLFADTGIIGLLIFLSIILTLSIYISRNKSRSTPEYTNTLLPVAGSAIAVAATHSCFDFSPHLPLYGITVASFIGLLLNAPDAVSSLQKKHNKTPLRIWQQTNISWTVIFALTILLSLSWHLKSMRKFDAPARMQYLDIQSLAKTVIWAPSSWQTWYYLGLISNQSGNETASRFGEQCLTRATELDPENYILWLQLGKIRHQLNMIPEAKLAFSRAKELRFWVNVPDL